MQDEEKSSISKEMKFFAVPRPHVYTRVYSDMKWQYPESTLEKLLHDQLSDWFNLGTNHTNYHFRNVI